MSGTRALWTGSSLIKSKVAAYRVMLRGSLYSFSVYLFTYFCLAVKSIFRLSCQKSSADGVVDAQKKSFKRTCHTCQVLRNVLFLFMLVSYGIGKLFLYHFQKSFNLVTHKNVIWHNHQVKKNMYLS